MKIGLLGAGRIGRIHGGNIAAHPRASLAAVADADAAAAQRLAMATDATIGTRRCDHRGARTSMRSSSARRPTPMPT